MRNICELLLNVVVLNTADVGLMEVCDNKFVKEEMLRERLDLLIKLVETSSLACLGQLKGKKGAELLWRKEVHLRKTYLNLAEKEREYRDLYENAPISYLSMDRDGKINRCNEKGRDTSVKGFLSKPVEINALSLTLRRLLDKDDL